MEQRIQPGDTKLINKALVGLAIALVSFSTTADTVLLTSGKDNTLYQTYSGSTTNSNGKGEHIFSGRTDDGYIRRALLWFDVSNAIPAGSTITQVSLTIYMSRSKVQTVNETMHRMVAPWGEGASNAEGEEGRGIPAQPGDATWLHRYYPTSVWATAGGEFQAAASASLAISREGSYTWSSAGLIADVQGWLNKQPWVDDSRK